MNHAGAEHHGAATPGTLTPFSAEEWSGLQTEDRSAAAFVVSLLFGIFCVGLVLYTIVALVVNHTPNVQVG